MQKTLSYWEKSKKWHSGFWLYFFFLIEKKIDSKGFLNGLLIRGRRVRETAGDGKGRTHGMVWLGGKCEEELKHVGVKKCDSRHDINHEVINNKNIKLKYLFFYVVWCLNSIIIYIIFTKDLYNY